MLVATTSTPPSEDITTSDKKETFGTRIFSPEEKAVTKTLLDSNLGEEHLASRKGGGTANYTYIEGWKTIELSNSIFGFDGWSCSIVDLTPDFIEKVGQKFCVAITAVVKIVLRDGTFHEDVGTGFAEDKHKGNAIDRAKKEAVTDARKRALRQFGRSLGGCIYEKEFLKEVKPGAVAVASVSYDTIREDITKLNKKQKVAHDKPKLILAPPGNENNAHPNTTPTPQQTTLPYKPPTSAPKITQPLNMNGMQTPNGTNKPPFNPPPNTNPNIGKQFSNSVPPNGVGNGAAPYTTNGQFNNNPPTVPAQKFDDLLEDDGFFDDLDAPFQGDSAPNQQQYPNNVPPHSNQPPPVYNSPIPPNNHVNRNNYPLPPNNSPPFKPQPTYNNPPPPSYNQPNSYKNPNNQPTANNNSPPNSQPPNAYNNSYNGPPPYNKPANAYNNTSSYNNPNINNPASYNNNSPPKSNNTNPPYNNSAPMYNNNSSQQYQPNSSPQILPSQQSNNYGNSQMGPSQGMSSSPPVYSSNTTPPEKRKFEY